MNRSEVAAGLLTVVAAGAVIVVAREWSSPPRDASAVQVCLAVSELRAALDLSSLGDQVSLRARAAHLADLLAVGAEGYSAATSARRIVLVLDDPRASVADLALAIDPVVAQCP